MDRTHEELTAGERRYLEHARRAQREGLALSKYCRSMGVSPHSLYSMRRQMREKGLLPPPGRLAGEAPAAPQQPPGAPVPNRFVAVRIAGSAAAVAPTSSARMVCRVCAPSGWVMECGSWPEASWLAGLMELRA